MARYYGVEDIAIGVLMLLLGGYVIYTGGNIYFASMLIFLGCLVLFGRFWVWYDVSREIVERAKHPGGHKPRPRKKTKRPRK